MRPFGATRIFLYDQPVDMRKSFEGLGLLVDRGYPGTLLSGSLFVFLNRNRTLIKVLYWDGDGFAIWYKPGEGHLLRLFQRPVRAVPATVHAAVGRSDATAAEPAVFCA